ncbi:hypothetical protein [Bradyrhizobium roseum]|uniref:hypothetical protein n=1 Tax=Bradyrhizobium roseum TaxID=3056648 RepID=UPI002635A73D|nr:hypothetical protein [Bradyrhizobium roseus]WKA25807.1 hypothetical protein QUH67_19460 [Bradyrhizobium roseus]
MNKSLTIKINQCTEQVVGPVRKFYGLLPPKSVVQLLDTDDLAANPRSAKKGSVTADIEDSLRQPAELFPAKTKGILLASSSYKILDRDRYQLSFVEPETEGILDGGHNALAAGRHILREAGMSDRELNRIKDWDAFRKAWAENRTAISEIVEALEFEMPIEILVPADMHDEETVETFRSSLLEIGAARNNNVQLSEETKANKKGFYDIFKEHLPTSLVPEVEWKTNDGGRIKVRDVIALSWVALSKLKLPGGLRVNPNQIYRNKAVCVSVFNKLLEHSDVSNPTEGGYAVQVHNEAVKCAMKIAGVFPDLYDILFEEIPLAYNKAGGSFGKISAVRIYDPEKAADKNPKYLRAKPTTPFFQRPVNYTCPDGFIVPLLYGLRALLDVDKDGLLVWKTNPQTFLSKHLVEVMRNYRLVIEMALWDPQKVGKNISAYEFAESTVAAIYSVRFSKSAA